jgi:RNase P/RNase MRP subunit p29
MNGTQPVSIRKQLARLWIGERVKVVESSCKELEGLEGVVVDERRNVFIVRTERGVKTIPKGNCFFEVNGVVVDGSVLTVKPEDRIKKFG